MRNREVRHACRLEEIELPRPAQQRQRHEGCHDENGRDQGESKPELEAVVDWAGQEDWRRDLPDAAHQRGRAHRSAAPDARQGSVGDFAGAVGTGNERHGAAPCDEPAVEVKSRDDVGVL